MRPRRKRPSWAARRRAPPVCRVCCRTAGAAAAAERPLGRVHFAHSDLSALPLFEEAVYWGARVATEVALALPGKRF